MKGKDPAELEKILSLCSTCGNCLNTCPVYNTEFTEPDSPRGKLCLIKGLQDKTLQSNKLNKRLLNHCLLCGSCEFICPKGVEFKEIMLTYRNQVSQGKKIPFFKKLVLFFYNDFIFKRLGWLVDLLAITPLRRRLLFPKRIKRVKKRRKYSMDAEYDILLFPGCVLNFFYDGILETIIDFLERKGFSVVVPPKIHCCGYPHLSQGWEKKFTRLAARNRAIFEQYRFKYLVVPCGTGVGTLKKYYNLAEISIFELTDFIYRFIPQAQVDKDRFRENNTLTYHDPCHTCKDLGIREQPRYFLKKLGKGYKDNASLTCCGFGGMFSIGFRKTSRAILDRKLKELEELNISSLVTSCPGCLLYFRENLPKDILFFHEIFRS